jgi:hypothetical protein
MSRLPSRSKKPPQLGELIGVLPQLSRALAFSHDDFLTKVHEPSPFDGGRLEDSDSSAKDSGSANAV